MSDPTRYYTEEMHQTQLALERAAVLKYQQEHSARQGRRWGKWVTVGLFALLLAVYAVEYLIQK